MIQAWDGFNNLPVHSVTTTNSRVPCRAVSQQKDCHNTGSAVRHVTQPAELCSGLQSNRGIVSFSVLVQHMTVILANETHRRAEKKVSGREMSYAVMSLVIVGMRCPVWYVHVFVITLVNTDSSLHKFPTKFRSQNI